MPAPDPQREPQSTTPEKDAITKTHEEFVGDMARPSISKQDYEKKKAAEKAKSEGKQPGRPGTESENS